MSKSQKQSTRAVSGKTVAQTGGTKKWGMAFLAVAAIAVGAIMALQKGKSTGATAPTNSIPASTTVLTRALETNQVAQSLMVTVELDYGPNPPKIADALKDIERRYEPASGAERTFAILDADGWVTASNKLHIQMHVSLERPGTGALVFRRTGEVLWRSVIVPGQSDPQPKRLTILMANAQGQSWMLDGSKGAANVLDVPLDKSTLRVRDVWPDGAEHEFTYIYSVCGCPVKAKVRRAGETTARTKDLPVMFPDDPAALDTISTVMGWPLPAR